jgi:MipA family protein
MRLAGNAAAAAALTGGLLACCAASAQQRAAPADWTIALSLEGRVMPAYEGAASSVLRAIPFVSARRAGTPRDFRSPRDGASVAILETGSFHLGPTIKAKFPRRESDSPNLRGLGEVKWVLEAGLFAEYWPVRWLRTRAEVRQGFGGHRGLVGDMSADIVYAASPQLTLSGGPRLALATSPAVTPYFSVTAMQSLASGLPVYSASGGFGSYGVGAQARYEWSPRWATHFFVEYDRLAGSPANSPLVMQRGSPDQVQIGIGATYSFDIRGLW